MAAASLGRLTLDLLVKLGSFEQGMTQAERKAKQTADNMGKAFAGFKSQISDALGGTQIGSIIDGFTSKFGSLKGGVLVAGAAITGMAVGGIAVGVGALAKMAIETAKADAQLQILANRANTSAENFQILQYAASGLGVTQDQLGSILADVQEKLGEFTATEGGGAADFFDALKNNTKMTDDQIKAFGKTLQGKDGVEAIQMLNDKMDDLGVTSQERRFVFESLASDLGNLAPLFAENGSLLTKYGDALKDAGVIKSKEALEQSKLLAAQTESVRMRFDGLKTQLSAQMMPALNSVIGYFLDGADKGGKFGGVINSVGIIAKGVGVVIIGVAASIEVLIKLIKGFIDQGKNVADTAVNVWNADGAKAKAQALAQGFSSGFTLAKDTFVSGALTIQKAMDGAGGVLDSALPKLDKLSEANLAIANTSQQSAKGIKTNTKEADENAKAAEKLAAAQAKAAKESANLNKIVGASALSGLRIKSSEAFAGGGVRGYTADFAQLAQKQLGSVLSRFTAFNDLYHKGTNSKHATGNAFDFTIADAKKSAEAVSQLESVAKRYGYVVKILDEYRNPSSRATGGHLHVSVLGFKGSADAAKQAQDELSLVAQTNEEAARIQAETQKAQQSIVFQYLSEREKMEVEHGAKILEIQKAFAGDDSAIKKYTDLQKAAYQKDVENYQRAQKAKFDSFKQDFADQIYDSQTRLGLMGIAAKYGKDSLTYKYSELNSYTDASKKKASNLFADNISHIQDEYSAPDQEAKRQELIEDAYKAHKLRLQEIDAEHNEATKALSEQQAALQIQAFSGLTGALMGLVDQSSSAYMALYTVQKSFNLAQAIMNGYTAISAAWASAPFPYNMGAVAAATIQSGVLQAAIEAVTPTGYADGGFTGYGGKYEPAGIVHRGEGVLTQEEIAALGGPAGFFALRQSIKNGFADGGLALDAPKVLNMQSSKMNEYREQAQQSSQINPQHLQINNILDPSIVGDYMGTSSGTKTFMNFIKSNRSSIKALIA